MRFQAVEMLASFKTYLRINPRQQLPNMPVPVNLPTSRAGKRETLVPRSSSFIRTVVAAAAAINNGYTTYRNRSSL